MNDDEFDEVTSLDEIEEAYKLQMSRTIDERERGEVEVAKAQAIAKFYRADAAKQRQAAAELEAKYAKQAWGGPTGGSGGLSAGQLKKSEAREIDDIWQAIRSETLTKRQADRLAQLRLGPFFAEALDKGK